MTRSDEVLDAIVIGAGWAGLGVAYELQRAGLACRIFERGRIGETWRSQRWDSFCFNTPNDVTLLPGERYTGSNPEGFMTRDDFVAMLSRYVTRHDLPVTEGTAVTSVKAEHDGIFLVSTEEERLRTRSVVAANGNLNNAVRPALSGAIPPSVLQIDASHYRNAAALPDGRVLVVGCGQSGGQIAEDLALGGRSTYVATSRTGRAPRRYRGRDIVYWMIDSGIMDVPRADLIAAAGRLAPRPLVGARHTISLQLLGTSGVTLLGRLTAVEGDLLTFADDLEACLKGADKASAEIKQVIDAYISQQGIEAPLPAEDPAEAIACPLPEPPILELDVEENDIRTIIWCTGFRGDYRWLEVPGTLDQFGQPLQNGCMAAVPGVYFAGVDFAINRRSGTILAVQGESSIIATSIAERSRAP